MKAWKIVGVAALCWLTFETAAGLVEVLAHSGPGLVTHGEELMKVPLAEYRRQKLGELAAPALLAAIAWWVVLDAWRRKPAKPT